MPILIMPTTRASRRFALAITVALPLLYAPAQGFAADSPGHLVLDTPAIQVTNLLAENYETVTRAGARLVAGGEHGLIILSDDNGKTWRQAKVAVSATILSIRFATPQVGWAIGSFGTVLHTADAGESWTLQLDGIQAADLMVSTAKAAPPPPPAPAPAPGAAAPAAVDPNGYPAAPVAPGPVVPERLRRALSFQTDGPDKPFFVLQVLDAEHARVIGGYDMAFETADGGKSWTEWDQRIDDQGDLHPYAIAGSGANTILAGERGLLDRGDAATGLKSVPKPPYDGSYFGALDAGKSGMFVFGLLGHIYRSTDAGTSWTQIQSPTPATFTCGLSFDSGEVLFADMGGDIWRLDGSAVVASGAKLPWPITAMVEAADGSVVVSGLGGISRVSRESIDAKPAAG